MKQIRCNVFETNSSSTHSIAICTEDEFKKWKTGEVLFNIYTENFVKNNYTITAREKKEAQDFYERTKTKYSKDFDELSDELKEEYIRDYILRRKKQEFLDKFGENRDCLLSYDEYKTHYNNLEFETTHYTSPSGDKLVITCAYGYD